MAIENNPIYQLAVEAERKGLNEAQCLGWVESLENYKEVLARIRKRKKKCFIEIYELCSKRYIFSGSEELPQYLLTLTFHFMRKSKLPLLLQGGLAHNRSLELVNYCRYEEALEHLEFAKKIYASRGAHSLVKFCEMNVSLIAIVSGHKSDTLSKSYNAPTRHSPKSVYAGVAWGTLKKAQTYNELGEYQRALDSFELARKLFLNLKASSRNNGILMCDMWMSQCYFYLGMFEQTIEKIDSAKTRAPRMGLDDNAFNLDLTKIVALRALGQHRKELETLETARASWGELNHCFLNSRFEVLYANTLRNMGKYQKAIEILEKVSEECDKPEKFSLKAYALSSLAIAYREAGKPEIALEHVKTSRLLCENNGNLIDKLSCDEEEARNLALLGRYEEALEVLDRYEPQGDKLVSLDRWPQTKQIRCSIYKKMGRFNQAFESYKSVIKSVEQLRRTINQPDQKISYLETVHKIYEEMIELCLDKHDYRTAIEYVEKVKSRTLSEMLDGRDLLPKKASEQDTDQYLKLCSQLRSVTYRISKTQESEKVVALVQERQDIKEEYGLLVDRLRKADPTFDPDQTSHISCNDIEALVEDDSTALIELFPMQDQTVIFIIRKDRPFEQSTLFIESYNKSTLDADLKEIENKTSPSEKNEVLCRLLRTLYEQLFIPIESYLEGVTHLVFIPYSGFHLLPLHAMYKEDHEKPRYLIDDYLVTYAPSAKILSQCKQRRRPKGEKVAIVTANPYGDLYYARQEANIVRTLFDESELISDASKIDVVKAGATANIFHYTGHAHARALVLHARNNPRKSEDYNLGEMFVDLNMPLTYLATLSACDTGKTRLANLDEYVGLTSAFLHAGAASVICSLWPVSDISTSLLMVKMYEFINEGNSPAQALRKSQLWLRDSHKEEINQKLRKLEATEEKELKDVLADTIRFKRESVNTVSLLPEDLSSPYYWAGFICSGAS